MTTLTKLLDAMRGATVNERREVANLLVQAADAPPDRDVIPPEDRKAAGAELERRRVAFLAKRAAHEARVAEAEKARAAAIEACLALYRVNVGEDEYVGFRDAEWRRLWDGRPAIVDDLIARCRAESYALRAEVIGIPALDPRAHSTGALIGDAPDRDSEFIARGLSVGNGESVARRGAALRELAEQIRRWAERGEFGDERELLAKFNRAYAALPAAEPLVAVVRRLAEAGDLRCREFIRRHAA